MRLTPDIWLYMFNSLRALDVRGGLIISLFLFLQEFTRMKWGENENKERKKKF